MTPGSRREKKGRSLPLGFLAIVCLVAAAVGLLAGRVHPLALAVGVAATLVGAGLLLRGSGASASAGKVTAGKPWRDVIPCYLSAQDRDLRIIETNALFRQTFGEQIGALCYRVYKKRDTPCPDCPVLKSFADGESHSSQERVITDSGDLADFLVTSTPLRDDQGEVVAVAEMSTNITEVKSLQDALERQRRDFKRLFDLVPCYISVQGPDLRIIEANEAFKRDFGEAQGEHCYRVYKGRDAPCPNCPVEKSFAHGHSHSTEETVITASGREAQVIVHSAPIRDYPGGPVTAVMEVSTNITEVKQLQRELTMMGIAIAGMAHRVKNILMGLEGGIFVVNTGFELEEQETVREGWGMVERNVAKISRIVKDLLYCSKERAPKFVERVSPEKILREVHQLFSARTRNENITLALEIADPPHFGTFDPDGLASMLSNLTANAIDACRFSHRKQQHTITLRCRKNEATTIFEVADDGPGIPDDVHHKVFENFFSTKGTEGTGLGLLVVQKVAEEHGGTVSFSSGPGEGTTFHIVLPNEPSPS